MPVKLILLTEDVNLDEIISAAADGEIDAFIEKRSGLQMIHRLNQVIQKLTWQHLCEISEQIIRLIEPQLSHVFDEKFDEEFEKIRQENHTSEFYLFDTSGSFLLIDQHGEAKLFFVRKADEFKSMHDFAKESGAMQDVLQGLTNRQHFPFTVSEAGHLTVQGEQWKNIMIPMRKIADRDVFYSVVNLADLNIRGYEYYHEQLQECV